MEWIDQYDEELDTSFEIPEFDTAGYRSLDEYTSDNAALVQAAILSALHSGLSLGIDHVPVFAIKGTDFVIEMERVEYAEKLEECMNYFTSIEEYEMCSVLQELKETYL